VFAAASGANALHSLFLDDSATLICLNRSQYFHYHQTAIDKMKNLDTYYIEADISLLPVSLGCRPIFSEPNTISIRFPELL